MKYLTIIGVFVKDMMYFVKILWNQIRLIPFHQKVDPPIGQIY